MLIQIRPIWSHIKTISFLFPTCSKHWHFDQFQVKSRIIVHKFLIFASGMQINNHSHQKQKAQIVGQLLETLNALFQAQSLRRNIYIFKNLNENMELPIKAVAQERRVMQILKKITMTPQKASGKAQSEQQKSEEEEKILILRQAISKCKLVQTVTPKKLRINMQGDLQLIRIKNKYGKDKPGFNMRKVIDSVLKNIKHQYLQKNQDYLLIQFQSNAAAIQSMQRIKAKLNSLDNKKQSKVGQIQSSKKQQKGQKQSRQLNQSIQCSQIQVNIQAKDSYQSLKISINKMKKQRKQQGYQNQFPYPNNYYQNSNYNQFSPYSYPYQYNYNMPYSYSYPIQTVYDNRQFYGDQGNADQNIYYRNMQPFIRRAVDTDSQDDSPKRKKQAMKTSKGEQTIRRVRLDSDSFPSIQQNIKPQKQQNEQK